MGYLTKTTLYMHYSRYCILILIHNKDTSATSASIAGPY